MAINDGASKWGKHFETMLDLGRTGLQSPFPVRYEFLNFDTADLDAQGKATIMDIFFFTCRN